MNNLLFLCGIVILSLVLILTIKKDAPAIAMLLALTSGIILLLQVFRQTGGALEQLAGMLQQAGIEDTLYLPVAKALGVAVIIRVLSALCKDVGQSAMAAKVEIAGAILTFALCLPLLEQVFVLISEWTA